VLPFTSALQPAKAVCGPSCGGPSCVIYQTSRPTVKRRFACRSLRYCAESRLRPWTANDLATKVGYLAAPSWSAARVSFLERGAIVQPFQSVAFVAPQPAVQYPPRDVPIPGYFLDRTTIADNSQQCLVSLLSHAHLPNAGRVTNQPK